MTTRTDCPILSPSNRGDTDMTKQTTTTKTEAQVQEMKAFHEIAKKTLESLKRIMEEGR